ncbi:hypothetical protein CN481_04920 [Bacillus sp. AFS006103]|nr:hypothetical protein CN481_04920 [Bacillus sp. AFS006103]
MSMLKEHLLKLSPFCLQMFGSAKHAVKLRQSSRNPLIKISLLILVDLWKVARTTVRFCTDSNFRSILILQLLNSKNVHQTTSYTQMDRYPAIFSSCREYLADKQDVKILSYGCSTGEEVLTLRRYFPTAHIVGAEINKHSLAICRKLPVDEKINFIHSTPNEIEKQGPFDAIFCMAVLQRKPHSIAEKGITSLKKIYPFEKFEQQIFELDGLLNPNGLLVIHYTQYSLQDTTAASKYVALGSHNQNNYASPVFDKNSNIVKNPEPQNTIFIKVK